MSLTRHLLRFEFLDQLVAGFANFGQAPSLFGFDGAFGNWHVGMDCAEQLVTPTCEHLTLQELSRLPRSVDLVKLSPMPNGYVMPLEADLDFTPWSENVKLVANSRPRLFNPQGTSS